MWIRTHRSFSAAAELPFPGSAGDVRCSPYPARAAPPPIRQDFAALPLCRPAQPNRPPLSGSGPTANLLPHARLSCPPTRTFHVEITVSSNSSLYGVYFSTTFYFCKAKNIILINLTKTLCSFVQYTIFAVTKSPSPLIFRNCFFSCFCIPHFPVIPRQTGPPEPRAEYHRPHGRGQDSKPRPSPVFV